MLSVNFSKTLHKPVGYAKIGLKFQSRHKNINLGAKTRFSYPAGQYKD